jgi:hypothetical protein
MARRERRYIETEEYVAFIHRILRALGTRVGDADVEMLASLASLPGLVEELLGETVERLRDQHGYAWSDIGRALGITRQAAQQRFGRQPRLDSKPPGATGADPGSPGHDLGSVPDGATRTGGPVEVIDATGGWA